MLPTWWAYSIALGIFMFALPFSRYMHIPAEMLLIPMRNAGLKVRSARKGFARLEVLSCPNCGVCIDACPMTANKANVKDCTIYLNRQIRRHNEKRVNEISDKCLMCGKCTAVCQVGVEGNIMRVAQRSTRKYAINQDYSCIDVAPFKSQVAATSGNVLYFAGYPFLRPSTQLCVLNSCTAKYQGLTDYRGVFRRLYDPTEPSYRSERYVRDEEGGCGGYLAG